MSSEAMSDLTSLSWLHNLNIMDNLSAVTSCCQGVSGTGAPPLTPPASPQPHQHDQLSGHRSTTVQHSNSNKENGHHVSRPPTHKRPSPSSVSVHSASSSAANVSNMSSTPIKEEEIDYKIVGDVKPPYSYASLICMAMKANKHKMTLSSIYKWIKENFLYYRNADPSWQVR